ncbi:hypothetical protein FOA52_016318 [Chlamydomonas sp. UWO 241]|nr:hypothetical protein FOA52_016318 [Chlamydomonas sp. UWO 241]
MMNEDIRKVFRERNPFNFRHVTHLKNTSQFDDVGPCVMMATPSGLQSGVSRDVFEAWCGDAKNSVIICDFAVQGTLAREILAGPTHVLSKTGVRKPLRCAVDHISFSAHADFEQTSGFLDTTRPAHVVLVHGEVNEMGRLKGALERSAQAQGIPRNVFMPRNSQAVQIEHKPLRAVRVVGRLAQKAPVEGVQLRGVLVAPLAASASSAAAAEGHSFVVSTAGAELMHPDDLPQFSKLYKGTVTQRQALATGDKTFTELRLALEVMFEGVEGAGTIPVSGASSPSASRGQTPEPKDTAQQPEELAVRVGDLVTVTYRPAASKPGLGGEAHVLLEWAGGRVGDAVADAVAAVLLQTIGENDETKHADAARVAALAACDPDALSQAELQLLAALLRAQFGPAVVHEGQLAVELTVDGTPVLVDYAAGKVVCDDEALSSRVDKVSDSHMATKIKITMWLSLLVLLLAAASALGAPHDHTGRRLAKFGVSSRRSLTQEGGWTYADGSWSYTVPGIASGSGDTDGTVDVAAPGAQVDIGDGNGEPAVTVSVYPPAYPPAVGAPAYPPSYP